MDFITELKTAACERLQATVEPKLSGLPENVRTAIAQRTGYSSAEAEVERLIERALFELVDQLAHKLAAKVVDETMPSGARAAHCTCARRATRSSRGRRR